jgi:fructokinase
MKPRIVSLGELLWDLLPTGPQLGGAPANLACHVQALGGMASLVSRVGNDPLGHRAVAALSQRGVDVTAVSIDSTLSTGTVGVELDADGHAHYEIHAPVAWDALEASPSALSRVAHADALCFGTLAQRHPTSRQTIRTLLQAGRSARLRLCDINLRAPHFDRAVIEDSLEWANALKLNETELPTIGSLLDLPKTPATALDALGRRYGLEIIILTLGSQGSEVWTPHGTTHEPGRTVHVRDTVGAGDSFTAAVVMGHLLGWPMPTVLQRATDIAAYVCTQSGATPELPADLTRPYREPTGPAAGGVGVPP